MSKPPKNPGIKNILPGKSLVAFCVLRKKEIRYKQTGEPYLVLELGDHSGRLKARIWENPLGYDQQFQEGAILKIKAIVQISHDIKELKIQKIRTATAEDKVDLRELLPATQKDVEELKKRFQEHKNSIENRYLKELLLKLFEDENFETAYFQSPAGKLWHHSYLSGLLEHVVAMLDIAQLLKAHYPQLDLDLLKCGIICHDVGKVREYSFNGFIDFSDQGRLLGYVAMGFEIIAKKIGEIKGFPDSLRDQLLHLILSHQNDGTDTGAVVPMSLEAVVLRHIILLDANTNALCRIQENDALPGAHWTKYIPLLNRFIYVGGKSQKTTED